MKNLIGNISGRKEDDMPYIKREDRKSINVALNPFLKCIRGRTIVGGRISVGEINYILSSIIHAWVDTLSSRMSYAVMSEAISALECAKLEFYRTVMAPYEDKKRAENGSVSFLDHNDNEVD